MTLDVNAASRPPLGAPRPRTLQDIWSSTPDDPDNPDGPVDLGDRWSSSPNQTPAAGVWWVGAHGGAGTSSLCQVMGIGYDCGQIWPETGRGPVILVARTHASGLISAHTMIIGHACDPPFAVVLVADSPRRLSPPLRRQVHHLAQMVPHLRRVGWIKDWRTQPGCMTRTARQALRQLTTAPAGTVR